METLTADPNWVVCRLKQLISIHQWRDSNFNSHSFRAKLENADDMWFHDRLFLWRCPLETHDTVSGGAVESLLTLSIFLFFLLVFAFLFWKMLIILIWFMDLWGVFFFLDFLPEVLLNPYKEGNPFNYCQDLVVRCSIPFLSGVSSSCMAAHGDSAPTLAAARPALCQWPHPSVSLHFRDVKVASAHAGIHEAALLSSSTIRVCLSALDQ